MARGPLYQTCKVCLTYIQEYIVMTRRRYSFWINDQQAAGLKAVKQAEDISESEQIRQAINEWLKKKGVIVRTQRSRVATASARRGLPK